MTRAVRAAAFLCFLAIAVIAIPTPVLAQDFVRGDCNDDGGTDIADPVALLAFLFGGGGASLVCESACDGNDDGSINIADAVSMLAALFGSPTVPLPGPSTCGSDPTPDALTCANYTNCASAAVPLAAVRAAADGPVASSSRISSSRPSDRTATAPRASACRRARPGPRCACASTPRR